MSRISTILLHKKDICVFMKFITVSILIFLMATQAFSKWMVLLEFSWNREYIANNLCQNKARPQSQCGGKC
jgi:hypothetical protein